jgi:hypothetical protein
VTGRVHVLRDPHDVGDAVLAVGVRADHVEAGTVLFRVPETGFQRDALAPVAGVAQDRAAEVLGLPQHLRGGSVAAVVDDDEAGARRGRA